MWLLQLTLWLRVVAPGEHSYIGEWTLVICVITELRNKELALIRKAAFLRTTSDMLNVASPFLVGGSSWNL
jgi:hypothetical protein